MQNHRVLWKQRDAYRVRTNRASDRVLLKDRAYEELKERILSEALPPGSFLSDRKLEKELQMSKTPIRAALARLESEGFVQILPQQGVVVRELSVQEIIELFDLRIALETFAVRRIAGNLTDEQIERLRENIAAQTPFVEAGDLVPFTIVDADFHLLLCEFWGNSEIFQVMWRLRDRLTRMALRVLRNATGRFSESYEEHAVVAKAVIDGDVNTAVRVTEQHLEYGKRFLVAR